MVIEFRMITKTSITIFSYYYTSSLLEELLAKELRHSKKYIVEVLFVKKLFLKNCWKNWNGIRILIRTQLKAHKYIEIIDKEIEKGIS